LTPTQPTPKLHTELPFMCLYIGAVSPLDTGESAWNEAVVAGRLTSELLELVVFREVLVMTNRVVICSVTRLMAVIGTSWILVWLWLVVSKVSLCVWSQVVVICVQVEYLYGFDGLCQRDLCVRSQVGLLCCSRLQWLLLGVVFCMLVVSNLHMVCGSVYWISSSKLHWWFSMVVGCGSYDQDGSLTAWGSCKTYFRVPQLYCEGGSTWECPNENQWVVGSVRSIDLGADLARGRQDAWGDWWSYFTGWSWSTLRQQRFSAGLVEWGYLMDMGFISEDGSEGCSRGGITFRQVWQFCLRRSFHRPKGHWPSLMVWKG
jgi:hypothetical protein